MANRSLGQASFTGTGTSGNFTFIGKANVLIEGGVGTVELQKSFDGGTTFHVVSRDNAGNDASYTTANGVAFNGVFEEVESGGLLYRFECTAYTSGTINCRVSK